MTGLKFTDRQLKEIYEEHLISGPRGAYEMYYDHEPADTESVEDFIIEFYTQYNHSVGGTVF